MISNFKAFCLTYKKASLDLREKLSMNEAESKRFMREFREKTDANEILVISTCNRTEIYYASNEDLSDTILVLLGFVKKLDNPSQYRNLFISLQENGQAIQHLFDVSVGLDSQVVGDLQITGQVKHAYQWSADEDMAGPFLHRLMHTIFFTNKRVVQETSFRDGAASVSYAAVELTEELLQRHAEPKILIIGLGQIGADVARNFAGNKRFTITLCNRTDSRAEDLAKSCGFNQIPFARLWEGIANADLVISSVAGEVPLIQYDKLKGLEILSYKYFIDLSVPRSVEAHAEQLPGVVVYDIDEINNRSQEALQQRLDSIPRVREIIEESILEFHEWSRDMVVSPTINKLKNTLEQIRREEMARYLKGMNEEEGKRMDAITKNLMQKIIKLPVLNLKAACRRGDAETLMDVLNDLFNLETQSSKEAE
jgi:glutamyl-tRNA reductase